MTPERFAKLRAALLRRQPDLTVLADSVNKTHNISAIVRTADAVGIHRIHTISTTGSLRRHHMIAGGAKRYVDIVLQINLVDDYNRLDTALRCSNHKPVDEPHLERGLLYR